MRKRFWLRVRAPIKAESIGAICNRAALVDRHSGPIPRRRVIAHHERIIRKVRVRRVRGALCYSAPDSGCGAPGELREVATLIARRTGTSGRVVSVVPCFGGPRVYGVLPGNRHRRRRRLGSVNIFSAITVRIMVQAAALRRPVLSDRGRARIPDHRVQRTTGRGRRRRVSRSPSQPNGPRWRGRSWSRKECCNTRCFEQP